VYKGWKPKFVKIHFSHSLEGIIHVLRSRSQLPDTFRLLCISCGLFDPWSRKKGCGLTNPIIIKTPK